MAAQVAEITGLPVSEAAKLYEVHGGVEAAVAAHFDAGPLPPSDGAPPHDPPQGASAPSAADRLLEAAKARGEAPEAGRRLNEDAGPAPRTRDVTVLFCADGVAFCERPPSQPAERRTGLHTFGARRAALPPALEGLEDHSVLASFSDSDPQYREVMAQLEDNRVPRALGADAWDRGVQFAMVLRDVRPESMAVLQRLPGQPQQSGGAARFGGGGHTLGSARATPPEAAAKSSAAAGAAPWTTWVIGAVVVAAAAGGLGVVDTTVATAVIGAAVVGALLYSSPRVRPPPTVTVNEQEPTAVLKVRLARTPGGAGGGPNETVSTTLNHQRHTVADLYCRVAELSGLPIARFELVCGYPPQPLDKLSDAVLEQAGVLRSVVHQRLLSE